MATFGFIALVLLSCLPLLGAFVMFQMWWAFGANNDELVVVAILVCLSLGGFYLAYRNAPFEIAVNWRQA